MGPGIVAKMAGNGESVSFTWVAVLDEDRPALPRQEAMLLLTSESGLSLHDALDLAHGVEAIDIVESFEPHMAPTSMSVLPVPIQLPVPVTRASLESKLRPQVRYWFGSTSRFRDAFGSYVVSPGDWLADRRTLFQAYISDRRYRLACTYLYDSILELGFHASDWADEGYSPEFDRYVNVARSESAFQNAYKAVEALIGEPGKDRTHKKIRERLIAIGVDPDLPVGYVEKRPITERVMAHHKTRDTVTAHGSGKKRRLRLPDIIDLQALARELLVSERAYNA